MIDELLPLVKSKFRKTVIAIVILATLGLALYVTKPDQNHFRNWLNDQLRKPAGNALQTAMKRSVGRQANAGIIYQDNFLFAIAKTKAGSSELTFVGVFRTWIPL